MSIGYPKSAEFLGNVTADKSPALFQFQPQGKSIQKLVQMFEDTITKARQQSEIQLTRHFKATSSFSVLQQRDDDQATENMFSSGEQSMDSLWLESQAVSYLFFFCFCCHFRLILQSMVRSQNQSREQVRRSFSVLVFKSIGPDEFQPGLIAPANCLTSKDLDITQPSFWDVTQLKNTLGSLEKCRRSSCLEKEKKEEPGTADCSV